MWHPASQNSPYLESFITKLDILHKNNNTKPRNRYENESQEVLQKNIFGGVFPLWGTSNSFPTKSSPS